MQVERLKVKARLHLYPTGDRLRKTYFHSRYLPVFRFADYYFGGVIMFDDREEICPGETHIVNIFFLKEDHVTKEVRPGARFFFKESSIDFGEGEVLQVEEV